MYHKKGDILILTQGQYSDYGIRAMVYVKRGFDFDGVGLMYLKEYPDEVDDFNWEGFVAWMSNHNYIEDTDASVREVSLGVWDILPFEIDKDALE